MGKVLLGYALGALIGYTLLSIWRQTALLEDLYILAHQQRRLTWRQVEREMAAAAASSDTKESTPDA